MNQLGSDDVEALEALPGMSKYNLSKLKSTKELNSSEMFTTAIHLCPSLESLALTAGNAFQGEKLWQLTRLSQLSELSLTNGPGLALDFYANVLPVLQAIGHQLENLILNQFACVDVLGNVPFW